MSWGVLAACCVRWYRDRVSVILDEENSEETRTKRPGAPKTASRQPNFYGDRHLLSHKTFQQSYRSCHRAQRPGWRPSIPSWLRSSQGRLILPACSAWTPATRASRRCAACHACARHGMCTVKASATVAQLQATCNSVEVYTPRARDPQMAAWKGRTGLPATPPAHQQAHPRPPHHCRSSTWIPAPPWPAWT